MTLLNILPVNLLEGVDHGDVLQLQHMVELLGDTGPADEDIMKSGSLP